MRRSFQQRWQWQTVCLILLLCVSLPAQNVGPSVGLSAKEGYVAICAGTEIIYLPIGEHGIELPADEEPDQPSEPCPWFGQIHAVEAAPPATEIAPPLRAPALPAAAVASIGKAPGMAFRARAPPGRVLRTIIDR